MAVQGFDYLDLGGGRNGGSSPSEIDSREFSELKNWYPYAEKRLRRRGGVRRITTTSAWTENITGMFPLKTADGTWVLVVAGPTNFGRLDGSSVTNLSQISTLAPRVSSGLPWTMFQYLNFAYALRKGHTEMVRITTDSVSPAGIDAPVSAPTLAQGAAGALSAANYKGVVTFGNTDSGMESNPSPVSNTLNLAGSKKIDWSTIPTSTDPFVTNRRLYRTLPDQSGEYFFVAQISNNIDTTFVGDNVVVADLGATVSFRNGTPPPGLEVAALWNERLFASDGVDLFFSELLLPEMFSDDFIPISPDDGHVIRGLLGFGDRLLIGKTNKMYFLVGTDRSDFSIHTLSDAHGLKSHHSFKSAEGLAFWFGTGKTVYRTDGTAVHDISTPRVADVLAQVPDSLEEFIVGAVYPKLNWYVLSLPTVSGNNNIVLVYNYKFNSWTTFTHPSDAPQFLSDAFDTNFKHLLYSTHYDGHIYQYHDEAYNYDFGNTISAVLRTKKDSFGYPGYRKFFKEVWALMPDDATGQIRIEIFRDDVAAAIIDRTASLDFPNSGWKAWAINNWRKPGSTMDMRVTYSGVAPLDLDALHFEVGLLPMRPMRAR